MEKNLPSWDLPIEHEPTGRQRNIARRNYELSGRSFHLVMDDGENYLLKFVDEETVLWGMVGENASIHEYLCMRANEFVWLVCFMKDDQSSLTFALDTKNSLCTMIIGTLGDYPKRPKLVSHKILFGAIERAGYPLPVNRHYYTQDLVGRKIAWKYSPVVTITHIYNTPFSIRSSLNDMEPLPADATPEQIKECESRSERWNRVFFEEPCVYIKINEDLYLVSFIETNRYRVDPEQGGGDLLVLVDTTRVHDVGRVFGMGPDGKPHLGLLTATGKFSHSEDVLDTAESPYWIK